MTTDFRAIYPGHPVMIAYTIMYEYPSYEAAVESVYDNNGKYISTAACCNNDIPGAGGNVHLGEMLLKMLRDGRPWDEAMTWADKAWADCDGQSTGSWWDEKRYPDPEERQRLVAKYLQRWKEGQEQADFFKPLLKARSAWWERRPQLPTQVGDIWRDYHTFTEWVVQGVLVVPWPRSVCEDLEKPYAYQVAVMRLSDGVRKKIWAMPKGWTKLDESETLAA
jgi:hypothetical protein